MFSISRWLQRARLSPTSSRPSKLQLYLEILESRSVPANLSVTTIGHAYTIAADSSVWKYDGATGWAPLTSPGVAFADAIAAVQEIPGGRDVLFAHNSSGELYRYREDLGWNMVGRFIEQMSAGLNAQGYANVWVITAAKHPGRFDTQTVAWDILGAPGTTKQVSAAANNNAFFLGTDGSVLKFSNGWTPISAPNFAVEIAANTDQYSHTEVFAKGSPACLEYYTPEWGWRIVGQYIQSIESAGLDNGGENIVFVSTTNNQPALFDTHYYTWTILDDTPGRYTELSGANPSVGTPPGTPGYNVVYAIRKDQSVWKHLNEGWFPVTDPGFAHL